MGFVFDYPGWFILFCALLAGIYTFILYFRSSREEIKPWLRNTMMALRFTAVFIIAFLLLSPLIRKKSEVIEKPLIIIASDNSRSISLSADSAYYKNKYPEDISNLQKELSKKFELIPVSFGTRVSRGISTDFTESTTDISQLMGEINSRFANRNVGALIIASDGIYNHGSSPINASEHFNFPLYTIALGDTTVYKDIILSRINHNKSAYAGDKFPVEILVNGNRVMGEKTTLEILEGDKVIASKPLTFPAEKSFQKASFLLESKEKGLKKYTARIIPVKGEITEYNNRQDFYVDITDIRQKIVFLYNAPHPDISAMRSALVSTARYDIEDYNLPEFNQPLEKYDLVVLYQVPSLKGYGDITKFLNADVSLLFVLGSQTNLDLFNSLKTGLIITSSKNSVTESLPSYNKDFSLFTLGKDVTDIMKNFPPLISPFGGYQYSSAAEIAIYQKMGNVTSKYPQIFFLQTPGKKMGFIAGENIWRWRLSDYLQTENHDAFNELISKIVQFLSVKGDKSFFRLRINNRFMENEEVTVEAEVFNETYEMINDPDVSITITDQNGKQYPFIMARNGKGYYLNAGSLSVGTYKYSASVKVGKNTYHKEGEFFVAPVNIEAVTTIADHNLLYRLAREHHGEMVYPSKMQDLVKMIEKREDIRPVSYIQKRYSDLIGTVSVFLLILGLLTAEWFLRKRSGNY